MNTNKLVSFAFASRRRKLAIVTAGVIGIGASAFGGGGDKPAEKKVTAGVVETTTTVAPVAATPVVEEQPVAPAAKKCDGVNFNIPVADGDPRDRDKDGIACEKN